MNSVSSKTTRSKRLITWLRFLIGCSIIAILILLAVPLLGPTYSLRETDLHLEFLIRDDLGREPIAKATVQLMVVKDGVEHPLESGTDFAGKASFLIEAVTFETIERPFRETRRMFDFAHWVVGVRAKGYLPIDDVSLQSMKPIYKGVAPNPAVSRFECTITLKRAKPGEDEGRKPGT